MNLVQTRGLRDNNNLFHNISNAVFSASYWEGKRSQTHCLGHAMLTLLCPGEIWPRRNEAIAVPVELSNVFVGANYRQQGLGNALVSKCLQYCNRRNWDIVLRVTPYGLGHLQAEVLVHWYRKLGFTVYARQDYTHYMFKPPGKIENAHRP